MICQKAFHRKTEVYVVKQTDSYTSAMQNANHFVVYIDVIAHTVHTLAKKFTCVIWLLQIKLQVFHSQPNVDACLDIMENKHVGIAR